MEIGLITAFLGGVLALLSPCAALLLPTFFAATAGSGPRLGLHAAIFYGGMLIVLIPLGLGAGALGALFTTHRASVIAIASAVLIVFGLVQLLGFGFDPARFLPGVGRLQQKGASSTGLGKTVLLGATSGVAGACAGPILGAVLTLAAGQGDMLTAGIMLGVYGAGMVVPLFILAASWKRMSTRARSALRGRAFIVLGRELHTTSVITGILIIAAGVLFWTTNGLLGVPGFVPGGMQAWLQEGTSVLASPFYDGLAVIAVAVIALLIWAKARRRTQTPGEDAAVPVEETSPQDQV